MGAIIPLPVDPEKSKSVTDTAEVVTAMRGLLLVVIAGLVACCLGSACSDDKVSLSENLQQVRADPTMQANLKDLRSEIEECIGRLGKIECLSILTETLEESLSACLRLYDEEGELCRLNLEVVAEEHGWSIPQRKRDAPLRTSSEVLDWEESCIENVDPFNCLTRHTLYFEERFEICDDLWGKDLCEQVLGDLMAGLDLEMQSVGGEIKETAPAPRVPTAEPTTEEDVQAREYEILGTAGLWSSSTDLTIELERLLEPDNLSSPDDAIWYSMSIMVGCLVAKENVPGLWTYVSDECAAVGAAGAAGIVSLVNDGDYEQAHHLAEAVCNASDEHLVGLAGPDVPTGELYTTASLASHGGDLARVLKDLVSGSTDSTPKAANLLSLNVAVDCDMAQDSPPLWSSVADDCRSATTGSLPNLVVLIDSGRYGEAFDQAVLLRDKASSHLLSLMHFTP
jgi:hypothetical protein